MRTFTTKSFLIISTVAAAAMVQACLHRPGVENEDKSSPQPVSEPANVVIPPRAETVVQLAKADLAARVGVATEKVKVVMIEAVEWRDSSLGCPQPDMMYAQVITPGYKIVLSDGKSEYEYHTDRSRSIVLCPKED